MKYTYSTIELKKWLESNIDDLIQDQKFQALLVEVKIAADAGNRFVNKSGYDEISKSGDRIETKYTNYLLNGKTLRINSAGENKRNGFDFLRIVDGINGRIFLIPHDEYFKIGKRYGNEFKWSGTYNEKDKIQINNTELLLKYEVTCNR